MNLANLFTFTRVYLSPVFFIVFFLPTWIGKFDKLSVPILWILFALIEFSDLFDGMIARARNQVTDFGKLLDPFADVFSRATYFVCFAGIGLMPIWILMILLYREFGVSFVRMMVLKKGVTMGARIGGKLKAWIYALSGIVGLIVVSINRLLIFKDYLNIANQIANYFFIAAGLIAILSFTDYFLFSRKLHKK